MDRGLATRIPEIQEGELRRLPHVQFFHNESAKC